MQHYSKFLMYYHIEICFQSSKWKESVLFYSFEKTMAIVNKKGTKENKTNSLRWMGRARESNRARPTRRLNFNKRPTASADYFGINLSFSTREYTPLLLFSSLWFLCRISSFQPTRIHSFASPTASLNRSLLVVISRILNPFGLRSQKTCSNSNRYSSSSYWI